MTHRSTLLRSVSLLRFSDSSLTAWLRCNIGRSDERAYVRATDSHRRKRHCARRQCGAEGAAERGAPAGEHHRRSGAPLACAALDSLQPAPAIAVDQLHRENDAGSAGGSSGTMTMAKVTLFKESGKYYTEEEWRVPENATTPHDMIRSEDFRRIGKGAVLVQSQEPWGYPCLFPYDFSPEPDGYGLPR